MATIGWVYFRYLMLWLARKRGSVRRWVAGEWRPVVLAFAAVTVLVWLVDALTRGSPSVGINWSSAIACFVLASLVRSIWLARSRIVIEDVVDHRSEKPGVANGLGTLLVTELARLRELYR